MKHQAMEKEINQLLKEVGLKLIETNRPEEKMETLKSKIARDKEEEQTTDEKREKMMIWYLFTRLWGLEWIKEERDELPDKIRSSIEVRYNFYSDKIVFETPASTLHIQGLNGKEELAKMASQMSDKYKIQQAFEPELALKEFEEELLHTIEKYASKKYNENILAQIRKRLIDTIKKHVE